MDGSGPFAREEGSGSALRAAAAVCALLVLVAVVAAVSSGGTPLGAGGVRRPSHEFADALVSLVLVALVAGAVLSVVLMVVGRKEIAQERARRGRTSRAVSIGVVILVMAMFLLLVSAARRAGFGPGQQQPGPVPTSTLPAGSGGGPGGVAEEPYEPQFALLPVLLVVGLLVGSAVAAGVAHRARNRDAGPYDEGAVLVLAEVLDETLDDLRALADPRAAVIACYARLERALSAHGLPRSPAEAPDEYLARVLRDLDVGAGPAARLTALYVTAKFSQHDVGPELRDEAIEALVTVREELRAAQARREAERAAAIAIARERATA